MKIKFFLPLLMLIILASCVSGRINPKKIDKNAFPVGFSNLNSVLLLEQKSGMGSKPWNNRLNRYFTKYYNGKIEMASRQEILNNSKYKDETKYRYVLTDDVWSSGGTTTRTTTATGTSFEYNKAYRLDYRIYDLVEGKSYPTIGVSSNNFAKSMKRTAIVMNNQLHQ